MAAAPQSDSPDSPPESTRPNPDPASSNQRLVYILIGFILLILIALVGVVTLYLTWKHPTLTAPIAATGGTIAVLLSALAIIVTITRR